MTRSGVIEEIDIDQCRALLAAGSFGRLAVVANGQPLIFPVNYHFEDDAIVFRTAEGTKLSAADFSRVAFEIDGVDPDGRSGWSVLVQGSAFEISTALDFHAEKMLALGPVSAVADADAHVVEIEARTITGRVIFPPYLGRTQDREISVHHEPGSQS